MIVYKVTKVLGLFMIANISLKNQRNVHILCVTEKHFYMTNLYEVYQFRKFILCFL